MCVRQVFYPGRNSVCCDLPVGLIRSRARRRWIAHCGLLLESPPPIRSDTVCPQLRTPAHRTEQEHCTATLDDIFLPFQINYNHLNLIWMITMNTKQLNRNKLQINTEYINKRNISPAPKAFLGKRYILLLILMQSERVIERAWRATNERVVEGEGMFTRQITNRSDVNFYLG